MKALEKCKNCIQEIQDFDSIYLSIAPQAWMLVADASFDCLPDIVKDVYFKHRWNCVVFSGFLSNPTYEDVCKGVEQFIANRCSLIVAVGGGSAIDVAKCIKLFSKLDPSKNYLLQRDYYERVDEINFVALPTTAGTGSESTIHAVLYYKGVKQSLCSTQMLPDVAILEPSVLASLPSKQRKATMLDALCQACESWWSKRATPESIAWSKMAISRIIENWKKFVQVDYYTRDVSMEMLRAANYAGKAINITATTAAHAMSYKLSSLYNLPHGISVALCFPVVWKHMLDKKNDNLNRVFNDISACFKCGSTVMAILYFKTMLNELGINNPVSINREHDINLLVESVNPERLSNNPIAFSKEELKEMFEEIVK